MGDVSDHETELPTATWRNLRLRAELLKSARRFFDERGFLEVETPLLSADLIVDRQIEPWQAQPATGNSAAPVWLQTSPEAHMKRLLAAGAGAIYQITRSFRGDEQGPLHNREFTILEWYRPQDDMHRGMALLSDVCDALLQRGAAQSISYREAFERHAGIDPHTASVRDMQQAAQSLSLDLPELAGDRDGWLDFLLAMAVAPRLGRDVPVIVFDFPASQAALARLRPGEPPLAERFELYVDGIELANGYCEETSAEALKRRQKSLHAQRSADRKAPIVQADRWLRAIERGLPPCAGVAMGFDRVVMLAARASSLKDVIAFPADRA
jgi:elongation factor P--(R)-beta-lysine ligase